MANIFKAIFNFFKKIVTRPGLQSFLQTYEDTAIQVISKLALVNNNADFHQWKDDAWKEVQKATGEIRGNWIAILIHLAYESYKAKQGK